MAKFPSWLKVIETRDKGRTVVVQIQLWHPYVWYLWLKGYVKRKLGAA